MASLVFAKGVTQITTGWLTVLISSLFLFAVYLFLSGKRSREKQYQIVKFSLSFCLFSLHLVLFCSRVLFLALAPR